MNNAAFDWEVPLQWEPVEGRRLRRALLTTYDRADAVLLAEQLLPKVLGLGHGPVGEGRERQYFLLELDRYLKDLDGRVVVVSSVTREEVSATSRPENVAYSWIWRSIRHLNVGKDAPAVQHAKLWMFHWGADDYSEGESDSGEQVEILISSANLTRAAIGGQIQAFWRVRLDLKKSRSNDRLRSWGLLPNFLRELGKSTGDAESIQPFIELLAHAECPSDVTFVASVPGRHWRETLRRTAWGAAGLKAITPPGNSRLKATVLCPYVGHWSAPGLENWRRRCAGAEARVDLELVWIHRDHPWSDKWILPENTLKEMTAADVSLRRLPARPDGSGETDLFHDDRMQEDSRWCHAKVYAFSRGRSRRVLVTSANFSESAWGRELGDGGLEIQNFELGVCVRAAHWPPIGALGEFEERMVPATREIERAALQPRITFASASWDGSLINVECHCEAGHELEGTIIADDPRQTQFAWSTTSDQFIRIAEVPWTIDRGLPQFVRLVCGEESLSEPIFDHRPSEERDRTFPPEIDPEQAEEMTFDLLLEHYGGSAVPDDLPEHLPEDSAEFWDEDPNDTPGKDERASEPLPADDDRPGKSDSYAVPAFELARRYLDVVDGWTQRFERTRNRAKKGTSATNEVRRDGLYLLRFFLQRSTAENDAKHLALAARLAADELQWLMDE